MSLAYTTQQTDHSPNLSVRFSQRWRTAAICIKLVRHIVFIRVVCNNDFQNGGRPPSWNCFTTIRFRTFCVQNSTNSLYLWSNWIFLESAYQKIHFVKSDFTFTGFQGQICLFDCLSPKCKKTRFSQKPSNLELWSLLTTYRSRKWAFQKTHYWTAFQGTHYWTPKI